MADFSGKEYWLYKEIEEELCKVEHPEDLYYKLRKNLSDYDRYIVRSIMLDEPSPPYRSLWKEVAVTEMLDRIRKHPDWKKLLLEVCEEPWFDLKHVAELVRKMQIYEGVEKKTDVSKDTKEMAYISKHSTNPVKEEKDKENFSRLCILMMTVCVDLFRDLIDYFIEPKYLTREIDNPKNMPLTLSDQQREIISHLRWPERYPVTMLDLSQLYIVIRYICHIPQPKTGWGFTPEDDDNSLAACMERIRIQKKLLSYLSDTEKVGEFDIKNIWMALRRNINEIQMLVFEKYTYLRAIDELYSRELTKSETSRYVKSFKHLPSIEDMSGPVTAYIPIQDKINLARLIELVFTIGTELIRNVVSRFLSPEILRDRFKQLLYLWPYRRRSESPLLILKEAAELHTLYRILTDTIPPHKNGWGNPPESEDNCLAACIERIMIQKDRILKTKESYSDFEDIWKNVRHDMVEIERQVIGGHLHEQVIDDLRCLEINPRWGEKSFIISKNLRLKGLFKVWGQFEYRQTIETSKGDDFRSRRIDSPVLTEFLNLSMDKLQQNISSLTFAAELLDKMGIHRLVSELESLKTEVPVILNRESYQRAHGLRPGTVFAYEVDVTYKKGKFEVEEKDAVYHDAFFKSAGDYNPRVILVYSDSIQVADAKLKVSQKFKEHLTDKSPSNTSIFIHHTYDENEDLSKLSVFFKLSFFCDKIKSMAIHLETSTLQRLVLNEVDNIFFKDSKEVVFHECLNVTLKENEADVGTVKSGPHYCHSKANLKILRQMLEMETVKKTCKLLGFLIYRSVKCQTLGDPVKKLIAMTPCSVYEQIIFEAIKDCIPGSFEEFSGKVVSLTESMPIDVNSEEWRKSVAEALCATVMDKKEKIAESFVEMHTKTKEELNSIRIIIEDLKNSCRPISVSDLVNEWQNRKTFGTQGKLKKFPSVVNYVLGRRNNRPYVKVFFKQSDENAENAKGFFLKNGAEKLSETTAYEFVNVTEKKEEMWDKTKQIKKKEKDAPEIPRELSRKLHNVINTESEKIYAKYTNIVGICVSNVFTRGQVVVEKPCIVLYCLDKEIIPFGERPLPDYIDNFPCDIREEIVMFGSCRNCKNLNPGGEELNTGCEIISPYFTGSAGFFGNGPFRCFLTAAHVVSKDDDETYISNADSLIHTACQKQPIMHRVIPPKKAGEVENLIFGNYCSYGSDVAIVRMDPPDHSAADLDKKLGTLAIDELFIPTLKVVKKGNSTGVTTGVLRAIMSAKIKAETTMIIRTTAA